jgi:hypothetical protein
MLKIVSCPSGGFAGYSQEMQREFFAAAVKYYCSSVGAFDGYNSAYLLRDH